MGLLEEVTADVDNYLAGTYEVTKPQDVPDNDEVPLGKKAMEFEATALFVDVRQSTDITDSFRRQTAAKMMKAYFSGAVRIINRNGGAVRSFNGDGMLVKSALGKALDFEVGCGIDDGWIYAVKVGIRGTNDVAWVGRATNTAAKLSNVGSGTRNIYMTGIAYDRLHDWAKLSKGVNMWSDMSFIDIGGTNRGVRSSTYHWSLG
jgi:uridylate cyclase